jgi:hypothetical protein
MREQSISGNIPVLYIIVMIIIRGHLLLMNNHQTKFEVPRPKRSTVIDRKPLFTYKVNVTLTSDSLTLK